MHALPAGLQPIAVVQVRGDNTPEQNRKMGEVLREWTPAHWAGAHAVHSLDRHGFNLADLACEEAV